MKILKQKINNNNGITLVELLATLVIVSIIGVLSYSVLSQGFANYQRIQVETELRDEADLIMANVLKDMLTLKENEIIETVSKCSNDSYDSFLKIKKEGTESIFNLGFKSNKIHNQTVNEIFILNNTLPLRFHTTNISLLPNRCGDNIYNSITLLEDQENNNSLEYLIKFTLVTKKGNTPHSMQFENRIRIIEEDEEVVSSGSN